MKQKYLQEVRKKMFWEFTDNEIEDVLEDINTYFVEASKEGITDEQFVERYGTPKELVCELIEAQSLSNQKKNRQVFLKVAYVVICVLCMICSSLFAIQELAVLFNMILGTALIWFFSGCKYCIKSNKDESKRNSGLYLQIQFWTICIFMQLSILFLIPFCFETVQSISELGSALYIGIYVCALIVGVALVICIKKMLNGNVHMFFMVIEWISLLYSLFLYSEHLRKLENLENSVFVFYPCIIASIILLALWKLVYSKERLEKWMLKSKKAY